MEITKYHGSTIFGDKEGMPGRWNWECGIKKGRTEWETGRWGEGETWERRMETGRLGRGESRRRGEEGG